MSRSTSLYVLKDYLPALLENEQTKSLSHYKRLIRFFRLDKPNILIECILKWVYQILSVKAKYLILDGTTWEIGGKYVHLLTLCVVYKETAIPIYWHQLNKKGGHSSQEDRKKLIIEAIKIFDLSDKILLADREFVGEDWLKFLTDNHIDFVIRLSKTCYKNPVNKSWGNSHACLEKKAKQRKSAVGKIFDLNGDKYTFVAVKNTKKDIKEPILFLISSLNDVKEIASIYKIRWKIETCFRQLKTKGFNLEDLNFKDDNKIILMVAIVVMAYVLSIHQGLETKKRKFKQYQNGQKLLAISIFRLGLSKLKTKVWTFNRFMNLLDDIFSSKYLPNPMLVQ
jgi:transposase